MLSLLSLEYQSTQVCDTQQDPGTEPRANVPLHHYAHKSFLSLNDYLIGPKSLGVLVSMLYHYPSPVNSTMKPGCGFGKAVP